MYMSLPRMKCDFDKEECAKTSHLCRFYEIIVMFDNNEVGKNLQTINNNIN